MPPVLDLSGQVLVKPQHPFGELPRSIGFKHLSHDRKSLFGRLNLWLLLVDLVVRLVNGNGNIHRDWRVSRTIELRVAIFGQVIWVGDTFQLS